MFYVAAEWSNWDQWTDCSLTCGEGKRSRTRSCRKNGEWTSDSNCEELATESDDCPTKENCPGIS